MKRILAVCLCAVIFSSCGASAMPKEKSDNTTIASEYDIDLTLMSSTMVYSTVSTMMIYPDTYKGRNVKMQGEFAVSNDNGNDYFGVIITDATACCTQSIEFVLAGNYKYPEDYPEVGTIITVGGEFDMYEQNGTRYYQLINAKII